MYRSTPACLSACPCTDSQIEHCSLSEVMLCTCFLVSPASMALLMYFRVCVVYDMNRFVVLFFSFTWLSVIAGAATPFVALERTYIGLTKYCITLIKHDYAIAIIVFGFIKWYPNFSCHHIQAGHGGHSKKPDFTNFYHLETNWSFTYIHKSFSSR